MSEEEIVNAVATINMKYYRYIIKIETETIMI